MASTCCSSSTTSTSPRLALFGLELSILPPIGTEPSPLNPLVNLLPLSLGIAFDAQLPHLNLHDPAIFLIHAPRTNPYDTAQQQVFLQLNSFTDLLCPNYSTTDTSSPQAKVHFWADTQHPFKAEVLRKMVEAGILRATGYITTTGIEELQVLVPLHAMSKKCEHCGRWESLVRNDEETEAKTGERWRYRRWLACGGCKGITYYCREECAKAHWAWHWKDCVRISELVRDGECGRDLC